MVKLSECIPGELLPRVPSPVEHEPPTSQGAGGFSLGAWNEERDACAPGCVCAHCDRARSGQLDLFRLLPLVMLCQDCGFVAPFTQAGHEGDEHCRCGGDFCGCPGCVASIAVLGIPGDTPIRPLRGE
jgi:hypothetical protein